MRTIAPIFVICLMLGVSSCIPSLHGIVTDDDRILNDDIIGIWRQFEGVDATVNIKITSDEGAESEQRAKADLESFISGMGQWMYWQFERAGVVEFEGLDGPASVKLSDGVPSMVPKGMTLINYEKKPYYILTHREITRGDTVTTRLKVHLTEIDGLYFMDFKPYPLKTKELQGRFGGNYIYAHTFAKYEITEHGLSIFPIDTEYVEDLIRQKRIRLKHERLNDDAIVLTASTNELRAFLSKYGGDPALFTEDEPLIAESE